MQLRRKINYNRLFCHCGEGPTSANDDICVSNDDRNSSLTIYKVRSKSNPTANKMIEFYSPERK
jgi:hypothetical protein